MDGYLCFLLVKVYFWYLCYCITGIIVKLNYFINRCWFSRWKCWLCCVWSAFWFTTWRSLYCKRALQKYDTNSEKVQYIKLIRLDFLKVRNGTGIAQFIAHLSASLKACVQFNRHTSSFVFHAAICPVSILSGPVTAAYKLCGLGIKGNSKYYVNVVKE